MKYIDFVNAKNAVVTALGAIGGIFASAFGGWTTGLTTLVIFMAVDYVTGLVVAGVSINAQRPRVPAASSPVIAIKNVPLG